LEALSHAGAVLEPLAKRRPDVALFQSNLAECLVKIGVIRANLESADEALPMLQRAKAIREQLVERAPADIGYKRGLAEVINDLGYVYFKRNDDTASLEAFQEVQKICQSLLEQIKAGPKPVKILDWLARSYYNIATIQRKRNQKEQALRSFEQSLYHRAPLVAAHPSVTAFHADLGATYREIAWLQHFAGEDEKAVATAQQAIAVFERLVKSDPDPARYHSELARSWSTLGCVLDEMKENRKAEPAFVRAVAEERLAVAASKDVNEYKTVLSDVLENLGEQYVDLGQVENGLKHYSEALDIRTHLHREQPKSKEYTLNLAQWLSHSGRILRQAGRVGDARAKFFQARELLDEAAAAREADREISGLLGAALTDEAVALAEEQKPSEALPLLSRAIDTLKPIGSGASAGQADRERLSEALWQLARIHQALGKAADAATIDAERRALWKGRPPKELAELAVKEAGRVTLIGYGRAEVPAPAKPIRDHDLELAAADLGLAVSLGFTDLATLESKPDAVFLLERDDVKSLIRNLKRKDRPSEPRPKD
jgi:tetratricopeptide (TPR) repeat protein